MSAIPAQPAAQSTQKPAAWKTARLPLTAALLTLALCAGANAEALVDSTSYVVGPGDKFSIEFFETQLPALEAVVSLEGLARVPAVGSFPIAGVTLAEAKAILRAGIKRKFSGVSATISLTTVRTQRALVSGAVKNPGIYEAPATALVSDIIARAGGLAPGASRRNIVIRAANREFPADLEMFTLAGDLAANPPLYLGDVVFVPVALDSSARIYISGEVRAPGAFEYTGRDRVSDLIRLGGGLSTLARRDSVRVTNAAGAGAWMSLNAPDPLPPGAS
ncbi:MAG TPA: SLBB domain-containing protein, partial [candidate division Zixibacteria bacterium]|nr:SLBB domain-containing protein [candidate division Zixibacteria bacterium]